MKKTVAAALAASLVTARQIETDDYQFTLYMAQFNKNYQSLEEYSLRLVEFSKINQAIKEFSTAPRTSWVSHNRFSDWTKAEREFLMGYHSRLREFRRQGFYSQSQLSPISWVDKGAVSGV